MKKDKKQDFIPPIEQRETEHLIIISRFPDDWNPEIVKQAKQELIKRNVSEDFQEKTIERWKYLEEKKQRNILERRARERYNIYDFIFDLGPTVFEMMFDWELREKGYESKHEFRVYFLPIFFFLIVIIVMVLI